MAFDFGITEVRMTRSLFLCLLILVVRFGSLAAAQIWVQSSNQIFFRLFLNGISMMPQPDVQYFHGEIPPGPLRIQACVFPQIRYTRPLTLQIQEGFQYRIQLDVQQGTPTLWVVDVVPVQSGGEEPAPVRPVLSPQQFSLILQQLDGAWFDDDRRKIAIQTFDQYMPSCAQVRAMLEEIPFDDTREMIAKAAWHAVHDPDQFGVVVQVIDFSFTRDRIWKYVQEHPR